MKCVSCFDITLKEEFEAHYFEGDEPYKSSAGRFTGYSYCPECGLMYKKVEKNEALVLSGMSRHT